MIGLRNRRRPGIRAALLGALFLAAAGCGGLSVRTERDASIPIPAGATYGWNPRPAEKRLPGEQDYRANNPVIHDRVTRAVDEALAAKGFRRADPATADFLVEYHAGVKDVQMTVPDMRSSPAGPTYQRGPLSTQGPPGPASRQGIEYTEGVLMVELLQRPTGTLAFRSTGRDIVTRGDGSEAAIRELVTRLLQDLPASAAGPR
jgi:hypothetical protein